MPHLREVVARLAGSLELLLTLLQLSKATGNNNSSSNSRWVKVATTLVDDHWYFTFFSVDETPVFLRYLCKPFCSDVLFAKKCTTTLISDFCSLVYSVVKFLSSFLTVSYLSWLYRRIEW